MQYFIMGSENYKYIPDSDLLVFLGPDDNPFLVDTFKLLFISNRFVLQPALRIQCSVLSALTSSGSTTTEEPIRRSFSQTAVM